MYDKLLKKFAKWLYKYSREFYRDYHCRHFVDMKCLGCNEWFSLSGVLYKHNYIEPAPEFGVKVICGQCGYVNYYNLAAAPLPLICDYKGTPYSDEFLKNRNAHVETGNQQTKLDEQSENSKAPD